VGRKMVFKDFKDKIRFLRTGQIFSGI